MRTIKWDQEKWWNSEKINCCCMWELMKIFLQFRHKNIDIWMCVKQSRWTILSRKILSFKLWITKNKNYVRNIQLYHDQTFRMRNHTCFNIQTVLLIRMCCRCMMLYKKLWQVLSKHCMKESLSRITKAATHSELTLAWNINQLYRKISRIE